MRTQTYLAKRIIKIRRVYFIRPNKPITIIAQVSNGREREKERERVRRAEFTDRSDCGENACPRLKSNDRDNYTNG